jgi:hypothetical protein
MSRQKLIEAGAQHPFGRSPCVAHNPACRYRAPKEIYPNTFVKRLSEIASTFSGPTTHAAYVDALYLFAKEVKRAKFLFEVVTIFLNQVLTVLQINIRGTSQFTVLF